MSKAKTNRIIKRIKFQGLRYGAWTWVWYTGHDKRSRYPQEAYQLGKNL